ncbi:MAG: hypothetical protein QXM94_01470 [Thermoplasmata archaeon]
MDDISAQNRFMLSRLKNYFKNDPLNIIITIFFIIFTVYWSKISIMKFYALHTLIWDSDSVNTRTDNVFTFLDSPQNQSNMLKIYIITGVQHTSVYRISSKIFWFVF